MIDEWTLCSPLSKQQQQSDVQTLTHSLMHSATS